MPKKIWIPIVAAVIALALLLSPIPPISFSQDTLVPQGATKSTAERPFSLGEILHSSGNPWAHEFSDIAAEAGVRAATLTVAASDSLNDDADYICDGTNDNVEIQNAIDALPATGGEVRLLDGTYNIEASLVLDSYQTLRGCGRNTILTTTTAGVDIITATGGAGTEKVGILIADLCIDGNAGGVTSGEGIFWTYVDYSKITNVWSLDTGGTGIYLITCDFNEIIGNMCLSNPSVGIELNTSSNNIIAENTCQGNSPTGMYVYNNSDNNIVSGNTCQGNTGYGIDLDTSNNGNVKSNICQGNTSTGIYIYYFNNSIVSGNICRGNSAAGILSDNSDNNVISGNVCQGNGTHGFYIFTTNNNVISGNICEENSQTSDNGYDNIYVLSSDYNLLTGNICRQGALANQPRYGISISNVACDKNIVQGNDLYDSGKTANFNDAGTLTIVQEDNREIEITQVKDYIYVKNTSAGALAAGDVVVLKSVAAGNEVTTTTTEGDQNVFGMVAEAIADNAHGYVQTLGKTVVLKVDGTADIAIGDLVGCFTTVKIGMKAASGKMAFAIALEAYASDDSGGVIDALLIVPRQAI